MIIVSSLSPKHSNSQVEAVESWHKFSDNIYTLNSPKELNDVYGQYKGVWYRETHRTIEHLTGGKPLVNINALIDFGIESDSDILLVNSDIIIDSLPEFKQDGMSIFSRHDFTDHYGDSKIFQSGFDIFFIPKQFLKIFPPSIYGLGACFFDYALPLRFIEQGIPVYWPQGKHAYHKLHPTQYSQDEWVFIGQFFQWEFKLEKHLNMGQVATQSLIKIKSNLICL